jgi:hypothetical protein
MSDPTTIAIACLLSSEAAIVPSDEDGKGHAIYQVTFDGLGTAAATQRWKVRQNSRHSESSQPPPTESLPTTGHHPGNGP